MSTKLDQRDFEAAVVAWRRRHLIASGLHPRAAAAVAGDPGYDVHELIELVERGCPPELAVRILAPLDRVAEA